MALRLNGARTVRLLNGSKKSLQVGVHARFLATIEKNTLREVPGARPRATPVSHDRATFTIRVNYTLECIEKYIDTFS